VAEIRRRRFVVSHEVLHRLLGLPPDVTLVYVRTGAGDPWPNTASLFVDCPDFDVVPEGSNVPTFDPMFQSAPGDVPLLIDWGRGR
jgi:hypothetical protein